MVQSPQTRSHRPLWLVGGPHASLLGPLRNDLAAAGFDVTFTQDGADPPACWEGTPPELVLVDMQGDPNGALELCQYLRSNAAWSRAAIVMLHDGQDPEALAAAREAGATEFFEQPFHTPLLEHRLNSALRGALALLEELPGDGSECASGVPLVSWKSFQRIVNQAVARVGNTDDCVAVLAVATSADGDERSTHELAKGLVAALEDFENQGPISHPKGELSITRGEDGVHYVLMPEMTRLQDSARLGHRIQEFLRRPEGIEKPTTGAEVSVSVGVANSPGDGATSMELCDAARETVLAARQVGNSTLRFRNEATDRWVFERLTLEGSLHRAIENNEFEVHYQPKVQLSTQRLVGFEALIRWRHPELGMVSPMQFIPLAEETGLIIPIGKWVLETACRQNKEWQDAGFEPVRMAVNLSPIQFRQAGLADLVCETLERIQLPAPFLELEVTESMLMHDVRVALETLRAFKKAGVYLSIDDFGTGSSSLSYLKNFPVDALKIDRSFIRDVTANTDDAAVTTSIILMGRSLNMHVIAEGVETENQRAFLQVLQCDEIQGYLISPPVPADQAASFLTRQE